MPQDLNRSAKAAAPVAKAKPQQDALQDPLNAATLAPPQAQTAGSQGAPDDDPQAIAARGLQGAGTPLPQAEKIQAAFGSHDVSDVKAHQGPAAQSSADALNANGLAMGNDVALAPDAGLHTAAHEAAHVVQQRQGVQLKGKKGQDGDPYERQADQAADAVVQGRSAEPVLDRGAGGAGGAKKAVQLDPKPYDQEKGTAASEYDDSPGLSRYEGADLRGLLKGSRGKDDAPTGGIYTSDTHVESDYIDVGFGNQTSDGKTIDPDVMHVKDDKELEGKLGGGRVPVGEWYKAIQKQKEGKPLSPEDEIWLEVITQKAEITARKLLEALPAGAKVQMKDGSIYVGADAGSAEKVNALAKMLVEMGYDEAVARILSGTMLEKDNKWEINLHWVKDGDTYKPELDEGDKKEDEGGGDKKKKPEDWTGVNGGTPEHGLYTSDKMRKTEEIDKEFRDYDDKVEVIFHAVAPDPNGKGPQVWTQRADKKWVSVLYTRVDMVDGDPWLTFVEQKTGIKTRVMLKAQYASGKNRWEVDMSTFQMKFPDALGESMKELADRKDVMDAIMTSVTHAIRADQTRDPDRCQADPVYQKDPFYQDQNQKENIYTDDASGPFAVLREGMKAGGEFNQAALDYLLKHPDYFVSNCNSDWWTKIPSGAKDWVLAMWDKIGTKRTPQDVLREWWRLYGPKTK